MIKKILNWSFGAFFRTIGRISAYFLIGILILIIGAKSGLKLFLMPIKATTSTNWAASLPELDRAQLYDCTSNNSCTNTTFSLQGIQVEPNITRNILTSNGSMTVGTGGIAVQVYSGSLKAGYLYQTSFYICSNKDLGSSSIYSASYDTPGVSDSNSWETTTQGLSGTPGNGNHSWNTCRVYSGLFVPNSNGGWIVLRLRSNSAITNAYPTLIAYETEELGIYSDTIRNIISSSGFATADSVEEVKEATDIIKEETEKVNDTLNDDDTTEADGEISGFFNDFTDNNHGLSAIITAPLNAVNSMLSTTCVAPTATYKGSSFSFPCGSILWQQDGSDDLKKFINLIYGGLICYGVLKSLFKDVNDLKNPDNDKVEVMDL